MADTVIRFRVKREQKCILDAGKSNFPVPTFPGQIICSRLSHLIGPMHMAIAKARGAQPQLNIDTLLYKYTGDGTGHLAIMGS